MEQCQRSTLLVPASISHSTQHGDKAIVHIRGKRRRKKKQPPQRSVTLMFQIHLTYRCDIYSVSISLRWRRKGLGSRAGRTTHVVKQLLREEIRKARHAGEESQMCGWELMLWRNESRIFLKGRKSWWYLEDKKKTEGWLLNQPEDIDSN